MKMKTGKIGRISELQAVIKSLQQDMTVCEPVTTESFDYLIEDPKTPGKWLKSQVKSLYYREDREAFVCFAKKGDGSRYSSDEVDVFLAVYDNDVFVIPHNGKNSEYWAKKPFKKWDKIG